MGKEIIRACIPRNTMLLNDYFHGETTVTLAQLGDTFKECNRMLDKLKLGLDVYPRERAQVSSQEDVD